MKNIKKIVTIILILISLSSTVFGISRGEEKQVYKKAAAICLECIGIG